jgi:hypothetical protein
MRTWKPTIVTRCCDCGLGTNVAREWFMVKPKVWGEAWAGRRKPWHELPGQSVLCIGCLEQRIGRTLCAGDFADTVVNDPEADISERMRQRLMATGSRSLAADDGAVVKRKRGRPKGSIEMTYDLAMAAAQDAANRQMRKNNRSAWNEEDYNLMCDVFDRLWGKQMAACKDADADRIDAYVMQACNDRVPED